MRKAIIVSLLLLAAIASCNRLARPALLPVDRRSPDTQHAMAVKVIAYCSNGKRNSGTGVMVSGWHVLTALHVIECPSSVVIDVVSGERRWRFTTEKEWRDADVARIQMDGAGEFNRKVNPPVLRLARLPMYEPVYMQAALPVWKEIAGESTGYSYGGVTYGAGSLRKEFSYEIISQPGNSGSGVYDRMGQLVGIHTKRSVVASIGYASYVIEDMIPTK